MQPFKTKGYSFLLYFLGFLLFWEWLRPVAVITNADDTFYFVSFTAFCFFLSYMSWSFWVTAPAKLIALLLCIHVLFFSNTGLFNPDWLIYIAGDTVQNIKFLLFGSWESLSDVFRTLLFYVLLWLVSFLMHYWLIQTRRLFLFFFITIIYLGVIDTFTYYHADGAIVRTMIIGLVLLGLLRLAKIQEAEQVTFRGGKLPVSMIAALIIMILFVTSVGLAAPKKGPSWPDPVPFIEKAANGYGNDKTSAKGEQTIGYDENDTKLGGPFKMDNTPVFEVISQDSTYWRVEVKDTYTGKGWLSSKKQPIQADKKNLQQYDILDIYGPDTKTKTEKATVYVKKNNFPQLIYGGELKGLQVDGNQLLLNEDSGKLEPMINGRHITPTGYQLTYQYPSFSVDKLKKVTGEPDTLAIKQQYLKLPASLPDRVRNLAKQITMDQGNRYDKAKAIEGYFASHNYEYNTKDVPVPKKGQDYVDQFLFESKRGYCDNFSSSMVVMLRSIGIPARWVKGFTEGQYNDSNGNGKFSYTISNKDAHSWVEAYFPGSGWVPFEPTKTFNNIFSFNYDGTDSASKAAAAAAPVKKKPLKNQTQSQPDQSKKRGSTASHHNVFWTSAIIVGAVILIIGILALMLYRTKRRWYPRYLLAKSKTQTREAFLDKAVQAMIRLLSWQDLKKLDHQTLREFAYVVDRRLDMRLMRDFVRLIEKHYYGGSLNDEEYMKSKELWENIIKKSQS